jgi:uncharacterized protein (DUF952 family)
VTSRAGTPVEPGAIVHLATPEEWARAQDAGEVVPAGFEAEGFVHCSTGAQLAGTIERHFGGVDELVLLRLDPAAIAGDLRWEEGQPGVEFPHVYRPLRLADVVEAISWRRPPAG